MVRRSHVAWRSFQAYLQCWSRGSGGWRILAKPNEGAWQERYKKEVQKEEIREFGPFSSITHVVCPPKWYPIAETPVCKSLFCFLPSLLLLLLSFSTS